MWGHPLPPLGFGWWFVRLVEKADDGLLLCGGFGVESLQFVEVVEQVLQGFFAVSAPYYARIDIVHFCGVIVSAQFAFLDSREARGKGGSFGNGAVMHITVLPILILFFINNVTAQDGARKVIGVAQIGCGDATATQQIDEPIPGFVQIE